MPIQSAPEEMSVEPFSVAEIPAYSQNELPGEPLFGSITDIVTCAREPAAASNNTTPITRIPIDPPNLIAFRSLFFAAGLVFSVRITQSFDVDIKTIPPPHLSQYGTSLCTFATCARSSFGAFQRSSIPANGDF